MKLPQKQLSGRRFGDREDTEEKVENGSRPKRLPGGDHLVRKARIKTQEGVYNQPSNKLCLIATTITQ